jgi:enterochelin esterase-like enzyme
MGSKPPRPTIWRLRTIGRRHALRGLVIGISGAERAPRGAGGSAWTIWALALPLVALFAAVGMLGVYRYVDNYWVYRGFAPPRDAAFVQVHGSEQTIAVVSPALGGRAQQVIVYLPPGYTSSLQRRYPVFYLLHGFPGRPAAFLETVRLGVLVDELVAKGRLQPLILVMPFGSTGTFSDKEWVNGLGPNQGWESFVAHDLVRTIDSRFRTIPAGAARAIGGLSEGGYGALNIAFHHPNEFRVVESWSGYQRADNIPAIFGHNRSLLAYNSPSAYLPQVARVLRARGVFIWFYSGSRDRMLAQNVSFDRQLAANRIPHAFFVDSGGHTWAIWRANAQKALLVAAARLAHG